MPILYEITMSIIPKGVAVNNNKDLRPLYPLTIILVGVWGTLIMGVMPPHTHNIIVDVRESEENIILSVFCMTQLKVSW